MGEASNGVKVLGPTLEGGAPSEGAVGPEGPDSAEVVAERLERKAESIRDELTDLVGELDHRRRAVGPRLRLLKPLVKPLAVVAGVGLVVGAARVWRRSRRARRRTGRTRRAGAR